MNDVSSIISKNTSRLVSVGVPILIVGMAYVMAVAKKISERQFRGYVRLEEKLALGLGLVALFEFAGFYYAVRRAKSPMAITGSHLTMQVLGYSAGCVGLLLF